MSLSIFCGVSGIMPALLMLGAKNNDDDDDDSDTKNDFLPLIMAAMSSNGNLGSNAGTVWGSTDVGL